MGKRMGGDLVGSERCVRADIDGGAARWKADVARLVCWLMVRFARMGVGTSNMAMDY